MKFQYKFKPGDIICSDSFHNGLCMIVESLRVCSITGDFTVFKSEAEDLDQALNDIIKQYADYYGTTVDKVNAFLGE
jgi:hypothetical protein